MNDHNLDDLIIDDTEPKKNKTKSLLTIFALLIVVFIVAIILTSVVLEDPKSNNSITEENDTEMISPELTLQNVANTKKDKAETKLTDIIEDELNKPLQEPTITKEPKDTNIEKSEPVKIEPTVVKVPVSETIPVKPTSTVSSIPKTNIELDNAVEIEKPKLPEVKKETVKATTKTTHIPAASGISYYIQVGSFSKQPSTRLVSSIKNNGFNYKLTTPNSKGIKKLLIGPYPSRPVTDTALVRVRDLINKSAFVVKK